MSTFRERHGEPHVVDSEEPVVYHGRELGKEETEQLAEETIRTIRNRNLVPGRKSLTGTGEHSPKLQFRVPAELRERLRERAAAEHRSESKIARDALERYLAS